MNKKQERYLGKVISAFAFVLFFTLLNTNHTFAATYKNFQYEKTGNGKYVEVTGYKGNPSKVVIPSKIAGKKVTSIGVKAFQGKSKLTSVAIPNTVKTIKAYAFYNCKKMKSVNLSSSITRIYSYAFGYQSGRKNISGFTITGDVKTAACRYAVYNEMTFRVNDLKVQQLNAERLKKTQTNLVWQKAAGADGYIIYRTDASGKSYKKIGEVKGVESYTDSTLEDGNSYFYKVKPYKISDSKKFYGDISTGKISEWGKYNKAEFELKLRNKTDESKKQGVYYEIFVRSFADSDGDKVGDFNGITAKLDYLKELGVEGIWLMPVNAADSYHGYDVTDYMALNGDYGTEEDFKNMLSEAHKRGIKVIMDFVINHTGTTHPWFQSAIRDINSPYRDYYRFVSKYDTENYREYDMSPWYSDVWYSRGNYYYYSLFYGMPDLNYNNPTVREEIKQAAGKWLNMGVDGFRLDAAMHIYGDYEFRQMSEQERVNANLQWWNEFAGYCETINPDVYLVGEAWQDEEVLPEYVQPFDTKFNFAFEQNMMDGVKKESAVLRGGVSLAESLQNILDEYAMVDSKYLDGVFATNHDQDRVMSQVEGNVDKAKLAANIYLTLPGNPYIYYGEELGMFGSGDDPSKRTPFLWTADKSDMTTSWEKDTQNNDTVALDGQLADDNSMYHHYKTMIALRKSHKALMSGSYKALACENSSIMAYQRECEEEKVFVLHNFSSQAVTVNIKEIGGTSIIYSSNETDTVNGTEVTLSGYSTMIIK